jgi:hypothetical protein
MAPNIESLHNIFASNNINKLRCCSLGAAHPAGRDLLPMNLVVHWKAPKAQEARDKQFFRPGALPKVNNIETLSRHNCRELFELLGA